MMLVDKKALKTIIESLTENESDDYRKGLVRGMELILDAIDYEDLEERVKRLEARGWYHYTQPYPYTVKWTCTNADNIKLGTYTTK